MYLVLSHVLAFCALCISSFYDVFSEKGDVPSMPAIITIAAGLILHSIYAIQTSNLQAFSWMIGIGLVFSAYGWIAYWMGLWGGADAVGLTAIGFAAPYAVTGPELIYPVNFFVNMLMVGLIYTVGFALYKAIGSEGFFTRTKERVIADRKRIPLEVSGALLFSMYAGTVNLNPYLYFVALVFIIFLYRFLKVLEDTEMNKEIPISEVEVGDVIVSEEVELPHIREKNLIGIVATNLRNKTNLKFLDKVLERIEDSMGYAEIVGLTEEGMEKLNEEEVETVKKMEGIRFMPVFPAALLITDVFGAGVFLLLQVF